MDFPITAPLQGAIAQLGERLNGIQEVASSILAGSTNKINGLQTGKDSSSNRLATKSTDHMRIDWTKRLHDFYVFVYRWDGERFEKIGYCERGGQFELTRRKAPHFEGLKEQIT
jgi:hypothetical protein